MAGSEHLRDLQARAEHALARRLAAVPAPPQLLRAMQYAALGGGKRIRASLVYATGESLGAPAGLLDDAAVAVELIHAYSLVHDDLPCMDDDDLRRGKPTCHLAFDEATALLAGDALQTLAFETLASGPEPARLAMVRRLAVAAGAAGMAGGQALDLAYGSDAPRLETLQTLHAHKTGALIEASVALGAAAAGAPPGVAAALSGFGHAIGLAFQVADDILDHEQDREAGAGRPSYALLLGKEGARAEAARLHEQALVNLKVLGDNGSFLADLADLIIHRGH